MLASGAPSCWLLSPFDMTLSGFESKGYIYLKAIKFPLENRAKSLLAITQIACILWKCAIEQSKILIPRLLSYQHMEKYGEVR